MDISAKEGWCGFYIKGNKEVIEVSWLKFIIYLSFQVKYFTIFLFDSRVFCVGFKDKMVLL